MRDRYTAICTTTSRLAKVGETFTHPKYGEYEVVEYKNSKTIKVKFKSTGNIINTQACHAVRGNVKDTEAPSVFGVGTKGSLRSYNKGGVFKSYTTWYNMIRRCYSKVCQDSQPTYRGCTVCNDWKYYPNFKTWFDLNYIKGHHLDKDIKIKGNREYSPDACMFVPPLENIRHSNSKRMYFSVLLSPEGKEVLVYNQSLFCRVNKLSQWTLNNVILGKIPQYRGWKMVSRL